ncbi:MAG: Mrp/NBP35 family ATP-binding protein [Proteobacteria bacterium]|nr:Mrp/NBP35 family ATP-binding protein [Pseudomonadota bacterium]MBI3499760.1 Mrp/NBP35 family ATP-binding protein [Pseudomonadota bacterium]
MAQVSETAVREALSRVTDPDRGSDIVSLGMVSGIVIKGGNVGFAIEVDAKRGPAMEPLRQAAERAVETLPGVLSVSAVLTAEQPQKPPPGPARGQPGGKPVVPGVRAIVAVASGKGGVGKSTTAVNLALALASENLRVGLLDADIYGPSLPRMMKVGGRPDTKDGKTLEPKLSYGIKCMSIGFMVAEDTPMIWRGPMVMSALEQMLRDVNWGELDILVVDLPPGTGDAQLTMAQRVPLSGAVIVSTPQDIALLDARKGLNMFRKVDVPVLGIVENMSYFICPHCSGRSDIFSHGGARREAERLGVDFLGEVPLDMAIRSTSDDGTPIVVSDPASPLAEVYKEIARRVWAKVGDRSSGPRQAPRIVIQ